MSEPNQGTRIVCPKCQRSGIAKGTVIEGAKIRCPGCGHVYEYRESYSLQESDPASTKPADTTSSPPANPPVGDFATAPVSHRCRRLGLAALLRLPGWLAIGTGLLQLAITAGGTTLGTLGSYFIAQRAYNQARQDLLQERKELQGRQQRLQADRQQLRQNMVKLADEMTKLIRDCNLKVTMPAMPPPDQPGALQPVQPLPRDQPPPQSCEQRYEAQHEQYLDYHRQWNEISEQLSSLAAQQQGRTERLSQLPWPGSRVPEACLVSLTQSSLLSAGTPLAVGYVVWVLGLPMICFGCFWLALVRRIFLAPPHCYLEPFR